jgi:hypothetical protein
MTDLHLILSERLPRPVPDPEFEDALREEILMEAAEPGSVDLSEHDRLNLRALAGYVGGAMAGAAALAIGAAIGWRRVRTRPGQERAA